MLIHLACKAGNISMVKLLYRKDAKKCPRTLAEKRTPLHIACQFGHDELTKFFLDFPDIHDIEARDKVCVRQCVNSVCKNVY